MTTFRFSRSWIHTFGLLASLGVTVASSSNLTAQIISAGDTDVTGNGGPDGWTNVLYINEQTPFDFNGTGFDRGVLTTTSFWVADSRVTRGVITPFIAEPLVADPQTGADFVIRAIGTTRDNTNWKCDGLYQFPFHDTQKFTVKNGWLAGFMSSDPLGEREDSLSPVPFVGSNVNGWLTGTSTVASGAPAISLNNPITEGNSGTNTDAFGLRDYQFNVQSQAGDTQPPIGPGGLVNGTCDIRTGNIAGTYPVKGSGGPDGWTNVLYINEAEPFNFTEFGKTEGKVNGFNFWVASTRAASGMVTPFIAEALVPDPQTGDDFVIRAIGTTREAGKDWQDAGLQSFPFSDTQSFVAKNGWLAGFVSSDASGESDSAQSPIPFVSSNVEGWLTGTATAGSGLPAIAVGQAIVEGGSQTFVEGAGRRRYQFNIVAEGAATGKPGDFDKNGVLDAVDINLLTDAVLGGSTNLLFDVNANGKVNSEDRIYWVDQLRKTYLGDSNLDGQFNSGDLVSVFQRGEYEDTTNRNSGWEEGDWDGDKDFTSSDFVIAFQAAGYEAGPRAAVQAVPEPSSFGLWLLSAGVAIKRRRTVRN